MATNYLEAFRGPNLAEIDRSAYSNKLLRNEVSRIPQRNAAEDMAIKADQVTLSETQKQNAAGVLARNFTLAAQSPRPRDAARALVSSPEFQSAGQMLGLPVQQFTVTDQDTDDALRQQMQSWAQALGAAPQASEGFTLSQGQTRYGANGQVLATAPRAQPGGADAPSNVQEYEYYQSLPTDEARAEYLRVKRGDQKPSTAFEKRLFDSNDAAFASRSNVQKFEMVANQMATVLPQGGLQGKWTEALKAATGNEDAVSLLRRDWSSLRASQVMKNLPPGAASDADVALAMSGFLPEFANAETVASFLRGLAKMETLKAEYHEFESEYLSQNGTVVGMGEAWRSRGGQQPQAGPTRIQSDADFDRLPSGAQFIGPDGVLRKKP